MPSEPRRLDAERRRLAAEQMRREVSTMRANLVRMRERNNAVMANLEDLRTNMALGESRRRTLAAS